MISNMLTFLLIDLFEIFDKPNDLKAEPNNNAKILLKILFKNNRVNN